VPPGWTIVSGANTNVITVTAGLTPGQITVREINGCADLKDTIDVTTRPSTLAGQVNSNNTVCSGTNSTLQTLSGERGSVLRWISTTDGINWNNIANTTGSYTAQNLTATTTYRAIVQNGDVCKADTSQPAIIKVDPRSVGGTIQPANFSMCLNENTSHTLSLAGNTGAVVNWQSSFNNASWLNFVPVKTDSTYTFNSLNTNTYYRVIVKSGVCPADTSAIATLNFINVPFPSAVIDPAISNICYGKTAALNATIQIGTSYSWSNAATLTGQGNGTIPSLPYTINATAHPLRTTDYVLSVLNAGCPNALNDTFHVIVAPRIIVFAGNDTAIVANQPLQLNATASDPRATAFTWTPVYGLNNPGIYNPVATLGTEVETIMYVVRATNPDGCYGEDNIIVKVFKTGPEIFVPSAFTPNSDGLNEILKPICVGIKTLNYFNIYNRWGQLVYSTSEFDKGWDGTIKGVKQATATFVYMAQGVDYTGKTVFRKGTTTLIR